MKVRFSGYLVNILWKMAPPSWNIVFPWKKSLSLYRDPSCKCSNLNCQTFVLMEVQSLGYLYNILFKMTLSYLSWPYQKLYLWKLCELWYGALSRAENNRLQQCYSNVPDTKVKKLKHYTKETLASPVNAVKLCKLCNITGCMRHTHYRVLCNLICKQLHKSPALFPSTTSHEVPGTWNWYWFIDWYVTSIIKSRSFYQIFVSIMSKCVVIILWLVEQVFNKRRLTY